MLNPSATEADWTPSSGPRRGRHRLKVAKSYLTAGVAFLGASAVVATPVTFGAPTIAIPAGPTQSAADMALTAVAQPLSALDALVASLEGSTPALDVPAQVAAVTAAELQAQLTALAAQTSLLPQLAADRANTVATVSQKFANGDPDVGTTAAGALNSTVGGLVPAPGGTTGGLVNPVISDQVGALTQVGGTATSAAGAVVDVLAQAPRTALTAVQNPSTIPSVGVVSAQTVIVRSVDGVVQVGTQAVNTATPRLAQVAAAPGTLATVGTQSAGALVAVPVKVAAPLQSSAQALFSGATGPDPAAAIPAALASAPVNALVGTQQAAGSVLRTTVDATLAAQNALRTPSSPV